MRKDPVSESPLQDQDVQLNTPIPSQQNPCSPVPPHFSNVMLLSLCLHLSVYLSLPLPVSLSIALSLLGVTVMTWEIEVIQAVSRVQILVYFSK